MPPDNILTDASVDIAAFFNQVPLQPLRCPKLLHDAPETTSSFLHALSEEVLVFLRDNVDPITPFVCLKIGPFILLRRKASHAEQRAAKMTDTTSSLIFDETLYGERVGVGL